MGTRMNARRARCGPDGSPRGRAPAGATAIGASLTALPEGPGGNDSSGAGAGAKGGAALRVTRLVKEEAAARSLPAPGQSRGFPRHRPSPAAAHRAPAQPDLAARQPQRGRRRAGGLRPREGRSARGVRARGPRAGRQETLGSEWKEVGGPAPATSPDITAQIRSFQAAAGRPGAAPAAGRQPARAHPAPRGPPASARGTAGRSRAGRSQARSGAQPRRAEAGRAAQRSPVERCAALPGAAEPHRPTARR